MWGVNIGPFDPRVWACNPQQQFEVKSTGHWVISWLGFLEYIHEPLEASVSSPVGWGCCEDSRRCCKEKPYEVLKMLLTVIITCFCFSASINLSGAPAPLSQVFYSKSSSVDRLVGSYEFGPFNCKYFLVFRNSEFHILFWKCEGCVSLFKAVEIAESMYIIMFLFLVNELEIGRLLHKSNSFNR